MRISAVSPPETGRLWLQAMLLFSWTIFRMVIASILLFATVMKAWFLVTVASLGDGVFHTQWFNRFVVDFELTIEIWVFMGFLLWFIWRPLSRYLPFSQKWPVSQWFHNLILGVVVISSFGVPLSAEEPEPQTDISSISGTSELPDNNETISLPVLHDLEVSGPYCGIYALLACFDIFDLNPPLEELLVPEYVGSFEGSSNVELISAAERYGLFGKSYANLSVQELKSSPNPMILHFRSCYADSQYNHWVAFLGTEGGLARIIDFPSELATIPFAELMSKWDGVAIEISHEPIGGRVAKAARSHYWEVSFLLLVICFLIRSFGVRKESQEVDWFSLPFRHRFGREAFRAVGLTAFLFFFGILFHAISEIGFLRNPSAVAEVTRRYYSVDVPEISLSEMEHVVAEEPETRIFDARYLRDFKKGSMPRAVPMPIDSSLEERRAALAGVGKTTRIVVFCQSAGCGYSDEIANFLKFNGYRNAVIYRGGWREWNQKNQSQPKSPESTMDSNETND